jgi:hypothetical protein
MDLAAELANADYVEDAASVSTSGRSKGPPLGFVEVYGFVRAVVNSGKFRTFNQ